MGLLLIALVPLAATLRFDDRTRLLAANTLQLTGATCLLTVPLGALLALLLFRTDLPGKKFLAGALGMLLFLPLYVHVVAWQAAFGGYGWLSASGGGPAGLHPWLSALFVHSLAALPWVVAIVGVGLSLVEPEFEELALLDASAGRVFLRVTLPQAAPWVGVAALWVAACVAGDMTVTDFFLIRTYAEEVFTLFQEEPDLAPRLVLQGAGPTACLAVAAMAAFAWLVPACRPLSLRPRWTYRLGRWRTPLAAAAAVLLGLAVGMPLLGLVFKAGIVVARTGGGFVRSWSIVKCLAVIASSPWDYRREFASSLELAALAAVCSLVLAIGLGWLARPGGWRAWPAAAVAALGLVLPGPVIGVMLIRVLSQPDWPLLGSLYDDPLFAPVVALTVRSAPLPILIVWHALRGIPQEGLDAALADGAGWWTRLVRIALPQRREALAAAALAAFAVALGDLSASMLVLPPGTTTLAVRINGLVHSGSEDEVAGISLALCCAFAAIAATGAWLVRRWQASQKRV